MHLGFVGTGTIATCVITGLLTAPGPVTRVTVSPRSATRASALASRFGRVEIASDNQQVIDRSEVICLAIRPQVADEVLDPLHFRADTTVISFVSGLSTADLLERVRPARRVFRMGPVPSVERHLGPVLLYPPDPPLEHVFSGLGTLVPVDDEDRLNVLWAVTAMMAPFFGLLSTMSNWLRDEGVPGDQSDAYVSALFHALSTSALDVRGEGFEAAAADHATRGGLNEQLLRELADNGWLDLPAAGLSLIRQRLEGRLGPEATLPPPGPPQTMAGGAP